MPKELTDLEVVRVAVVGKAANKRRWLLLKNDDGTDVELPELETQLEQTEDESLPDDLALELAVETEDAIPTEETDVEIGKADVSTAPWANVDTTKLPKSCFLWIEGDGSTKAQWHLPVYEGAGPMGKDGMHMQRGPLNANAVRAALSAVAGGRTGKPMNVPAEVKARLEQLATSLNIGGRAEQKKGDDPMANEIEITEEGGNEDVNADIEELKKQAADQAKELVELKKQAEKVAIVEKAVAEKEVALKAAQGQLEQMQGVIKAQQKAARAKELEALCKAATLDFEAVWKAEEVNAEGAKVFEDAIAKLVKQVDGFMGQEAGSAQHNEEGTDDPDVRVRKYQNEHPGTNYGDALSAVAKNDPDWAKQFQAGRK